MSTFLQLKQEVLGYGFQSARYLTSVGNWINEGQRLIAKNSVLRTQVTTSTIATAASDPTYTLPTDFGRIIDIFYSPDEDVLEEVASEIDFDQLDQPSAGRPDRFIIIGDQITVYPTPDAVYTFTLRYNKLPPDLVNDTDVPQIPSEYHYLLETYALYKAYRRQNDYSAAQFHKQEFDRDFAVLKNEVHRANTSRPKQVPGTWSNLAR